MQIEIAIEDSSCTEKDQTFLVKFTDREYVFVLPYSEVMNMFHDDNEEEPNYLYLNSLFQELTPIEPSTGQKLALIEAGTRGHEAISINFGFSYAEMKIMVVDEAIFLYNEAIEKIRRSKDGDYLYDAITDLINSYYTIEDAQKQIH